jgi:hypothetical protein
MLPSDANDPASASRFRLSWTAGADPRHDQPQASDRYPACARSRAPIPPDAHGVVVYRSPDRSASSALTPRVIAPSPPQALAVEVECQRSRHSGKPVVNQPPAQIRQGRGKEALGRAAETQARGDLNEPPGTLPGVFPRHLAGALGQRSRRVATRARPHHRRWQACDRVGSIPHTGRRRAGSRTDERLPAGRLVGVSSRATHDTALIAGDRLAPARGRGPGDEDLLEHAAFCRGGGTVPAMASRRSRA